MNPIKDVKTLTKAVTTPFEAVFVTGLCAFINVATTPGGWWFQWVALGMAIAVLCAWADAFKVAVRLGLAGALAVVVYRFAKGRTPANTPTA
jgi:hypothetical protein